MGLARMKKIAFICLSLVFLLGLTGIAWADDPLDNFDYFYGYVKNQQSETVSKGTIEAYINNEERGEVNFQNGQYGIPMEDPFVVKLLVHGTTNDRDKPIQFKVKIGDVSYTAQTDPETVTYQGSMNKRQVNLIIPTAGINGFAKLEKVKPSDPEPDHAGTEVKASQGGSLVETVTTSSDGSYTVTGVAAGDSVLVFTNPGGSWKKVAKTVNVKAGEITNAGTVTLYLGDMNADGSINILDLLWMASKMGPVNEQSQKADVNSDNLINILDLLRVSSNIGK